MDIGVIMLKSDNIDLVAKALAVANKSIGKATKESNNPFFKSKYADLAQIIEVVKEPLSEQGLVILQPQKTVLEQDKLNTYVETIIMHESGQFLGSETLVICAKQNDPQALGSGITYARRYGLQSLLNIPAVDDDGEAAMSRDIPKNGSLQGKPKMAF